MGLGVAHFYTVVTRTDLTIQLSGLEHHGYWAAVPQIPVLVNLVVRDITVFIRAALETALMLLHTCDLVGITTRHCPRLLNTCVSMVCQLAGFIKRVRPLQHYPVLHGGLKATQEYIPCQRIIVVLHPHFKLQLLEITYIIGNTPQVF